MFQSLVCLLTLFVCLNGSAMKGNAEFWHSRFAAKSVRATWNEFQAATRGQFATRAEAGVETRTGTGAGLKPTAVTRPEPCQPTAPKTQLSLPAPKQPVALLPEAAESLAAKTTPPRVFYVTPRGVAVSSKTLAGQGSSRLVGNFQGLAGASVDDVIARVPSGWTWAPQRSGQGIVFSDTAGFERLRMHGPSMNAPVGSNSRMGWTLRVMNRAGGYYDDAGRLVPYTANEGHIPLIGNPNAP
jgi:hypothetical protein